MDLDYAQRKLAQSVECLVGLGTIQQRVRKAWGVGLSMIAALQALPADACTELKIIGDAVAAREMAAQDALRHAQRILALYEKVTRLCAERSLKRAV